MFITVLYYLNASAFSPTYLIEGVFRLSRSNALGEQREIIRTSAQSFIKSLLIKTVDNLIHGLHFPCQTAYYVWIGFSAVYLSTCGDLGIEHWFSTTHDD
jgi:hypothetical protein